MKVEMIPIEGVIVRCLIVDDNDKWTHCENCGAQNYNHELLAKEDDEWCMDCNDKHYRKDWSDMQLGQWTVQQMIAGKITHVVRDANKK